MSQIFPLSLHLGFAMLQILPAIPGSEFPTVPVSGTLSDTEHSIDYPLKNGSSHRCHIEREQQGVPVFCQVLEATRDYIAERLKNPKAAKKLMTALLKAISLLADNPYMGAALAEKFEITTDVRYFVVAKQLIFYRVDEENSTIEILRILDGRTDYLSVLFG